MSGEWVVIGRRWINCETFMICLDNLLTVGKVNLERGRPDLGPNTSQILPGLEFTFQGSESTPLEVDYIKEAHRDQVYDAIWAALKG